MNSRSGNLKVNFRDIARSLDISVMTLYRVVNNDPKVKRETRSKVIDALNRHGYYTHKTLKNIKVIFDFTEHEYLTHYGKRLMSNIAKLNYTCIECNHRKQRRQFLDHSAISDIAVFISIPDEKIIEQARKANPDLYTITISTKSNADVTISPDNTSGGELAARHLHEHGHQHVAVHLSESHPTRMERYKAFFAEFKLLKPDSKIDLIIEKTGQSTEDTLRNYFDSSIPQASAVLFLTGAFAEVYYNEFAKKFPERFASLSVMAFDRPEDLEYTSIKHNFDRIEFISQDLLDWAEYYITNRPMMKKRSPVHTCTNVRLIKTGSVQKIK